MCCALRKDFLASKSFSNVFFLFLLCTGYMLTLYCGQAAAAAACLLYWNAPNSDRFWLFYCLSLLFALLFLLPSTLNLCGQYTASALDQQRLLSVHLSSLNNRFSHFTIFHPILSQKKKKTLRTLVFLSSLPQALYLTHWSSSSN